MMRATLRSETRLHFIKRRQPTASSAGCARVRERPPHVPCKGDSESASRLIRRSVVDKESSLWTLPIDRSNKNLHPFTPLTLTQVLYCSKGKQDLKTQTIAQRPSSYLVRRICSSTSHGVACCRYRLFSSSPPAPRLDLVLRSLRPLCPSPLVPSQVRSRIRQAATAPR